jgi:hypothetical protein
MINDVVIQNVFIFHWSTGPWIEMWELMAVAKVLMKLIVLVVEPWVLVNGLKLVLMVMHSWFKSGDLQWTHIIVVIRSRIDTNLRTSRLVILTLLSCIQNSIRIMANFHVIKQLLKWWQGAVCIVCCIGNTTIVTQCTGNFRCSWLCDGKWWVLLLLFTDVANMYLLLSQAL